MANPLTILNINGPFREPREPAFSYDFAIQRSAWPMPHAVRVKVAVAEELDHLKTKILELQGGSPGQQLLISQLLTKHIANRKLQIANEENMFNERLDILIEPFTGPLAHLFPRLETWMNDSKAALRQEIREKVRL
jgi:hypothetical protein